MFDLLILLHTHLLYVIIFISLVILRKLCENVKKSLSAAGESLALKLVCLWCSALRCDASEQHGGGGAGGGGGGGRWGADEGDRGKREGWRMMFWGEGG